jgi:bacterioferritin-associated ferredoxin
MYVCVCNEVTDHQIRKAVREGATSVRELHRELKVASQCGKCASTARCVLEVTLAELSCDRSLARA